VNKPLIQEPGNLNNNSVVFLPIADTEGEEVAGKHVYLMVNGGIVVKEGVSEKAYYMPSIWNAKKEDKGFSFGRNCGGNKTSPSLLTLLSTLTSLTLFKSFSVNGPALFACRASRLVGGIDEQVFT
jgi:hypothetical protein